MRSLRGAFLPLSHLLSVLPPPLFSQSLTRRLNFALVDEADSVLIDEGRNPMIISLSLSQNEMVVRMVDKVRQGGGGARGGGGRGEGGGWAIQGETGVGGGP